MSAQFLTDNLYRELLIISMMILIILLMHNLVLYRQKLSSFFSLMLLSGAVMCVFELLWDLMDDHIGLTPLLYLWVGLYTMAFLNFAVFFNRYFLECFGILIKKKWLVFLCYGLPNIIVAIFCVTTPWTRLFYVVDDTGLVREMPLYSGLYYSLLWIYSLSALFLAVLYMIRTRDKKSSLFQIARSMIVFGFLSPAVYIMQILLLHDSESDYLAMSLAVAVSLVYLTANVNIHSLLKSRAQVEAVEADLRIAASIQSDALPSPNPVFSDHPEIELCACMTTAKEVGGDFYDYFAIDENRLCFLIADVSGKGMPAALFMMTAKTTIQDYALTRADTAEIFTEVNRRLCEGNESHMFATAWIGILDTKTHILQYTNAGQTYPVFCRAGEPGMILKKGHGLFLAGMNDTKYRFDELKLSSGDRLLLYTDGVTEAHSESLELYGRDRLLSAVDSASGQDGKTTLDLILRDVNTFAGGEPQFDDITMVILSIK